MKFLIISVEGGSLGMAMKLKAEGNTVAWWKKGTRGRRSWG